MPRDEVMQGTSGTVQGARSKGHVARANRHWTDRECDERLMSYLLADEQVCARWKTALRGIGVVALLVIGSMALLAW